MRSFSELFAAFALVAQTATASYYNWTYGEYYSGYRNYNYNNRNNYYS